MVSCIEPDRLYLGDIDDGHHADEYGIAFDRVITTGPEEPTDFTTDHYVFPDGGYGWDPKAHYFHFKRAVNTVRDALLDGDTVLVHCMAGQSRSVMVVVAALASLDGLSYDEAWEQVRDKRGSAHPTRELEKCARKYISSYDIHFG